MLLLGREASSNSRKEGGIALETTHPGSRQSQDLMSPERSSEQRVPFAMARSECRAMGTTISMLLPEERHQQGTEIVRDLFSTWERTLSRFLPESELTHLNQQAGTACIVSPLLFTVLARALEAAQASEGLYDPTLLVQLRQAGYDRSFVDLPSQLPAASQQSVPGGGWRAIRLDPSVRLVVLPSGVGLDFGGIAKGMAVDATLKALGEAGICCALVNAGGDLAVMGVPAREKYWSIAVQGNRSSWTLALQRGAIATSGIGRRRWLQGTQRRHHLLDPRTGQPAQSGLWSVSVAAARCEQAEVAAKVALLLGKEQGAAFLHRHGLAGQLVQEDDTRTTVGSWPKEAARGVEEQRENTHEPIE